MVAILGHTEKALVWLLLLPSFDDWWWVSDGQNHFCQRTFEPVPFSRKAWRDPRDNSHAIEYLPWQTGKNAGN